MILSAFLLLYNQNDLSEKFVIKDPSFFLQFLHCIYETKRLSSNFYLEDIIFFIALI
jgi:hypothetical protein